MNRILKYKIAILSILLPAMILLAGNAVFNWHVHKSSDGNLIVHAHPFHKTGNSQSSSNHNHSAQEYFSIQHFTSFFFVLAALLFVSLSLGKIIEVSKVYHYYVKKRLLATLLPNRAPPVLAY
nr:hypothetical protein [uncultured Marinifilum sp.]